MSSELAPGIVAKPIHSNNFGAATHPLINCSASKMMIAQSKPNQRHDFRAGD
jgi:hypothetical protein